MLAGANGSDATYFKGIRRVMPGHVVQFTRTGSKSWRHWNPPQNELRLSPNGYVETYLEKLQTAVLAHLRRDSGEVSVHLSAGFDSSAVAAMAARLSGNEKPLAFTSAPRAGFQGTVPPGRIADESGLAALTAQAHGMKHIIVRSDRGVCTGLREYCRLYQEPHVNLVNMAWARQISEDSVRRGAKLLLTGEMGNLTINAGGLPALAELIRARHYGRWLTEATAAAGSGRARWRGVLVNSFPLPSIIRDILDRTVLGIPSGSEQAFVRPEWLPERREAPEAYRGRYRARFEQIAGYEVGLFRAGGLAEFGLHDRDPLADRRLLDFSFTLPPEQLLHAGVWRPLARRALTGLLPDQVLDSPVRGYQGADWYERFTEADARRLLEEISSSSAAAELLDLPKIRSAIDGWPTGGWADSRTTVIYRTRVPIALITGVFLQEFESLVSADSD
jgi:asparagine synthase (glutamine-hydrolysing)